MNTENFENSKLSRKIYTSCSLSGDEFLKKYLTYKIPLLFNLYENRLVQFEFLKEVFADLLETKEILRFNFQNKLFSFYQANNNFCIIKISFLQKAKIIFLGTAVILLIRSFPYKLFINENRIFFRLYRNKLLRVLKSPFSLSLIIVNKVCRKIKIHFSILSKIIRSIFLNFSLNLFLKYGQYRILIKQLDLNSENYKILFSRSQNLKNLKILTSFFVFLLCLVFNDYILLNRFLVNFRAKPTYSSEKVN
jgi:hypothetical protein